MRELLEFITTPIIYERLFYLFLIGNEIPLPTVCSHDVNRSNVDGYKLKCLKTLLVKKKNFIIVFIF